MCCECGELQIKRTLNEDKNAAGDKEALVLQWWNMVVKCSGIVGETQKFSISLNCYFWEKDGQSMIKCKKQNS